MTGKASGVVSITFAKGVLEDIAEMTAPAADSDQAGKDETENLKRRIAELLVECKDNPFIGELMGRASTPSWPTAGGSDSTSQAIWQSPASA
jgi:hypothetical protein